MSMKSHFHNNLITPAFGWLRQSNEESQPKPKRVRDIAPTLVRTKKKEKLGRERQSEETREGVVHNSPSEDIRVMSQTGPF